MEARDFMNVESFSQLPFIRSAPAVAVKDKPPIRLFGIEFRTDTAAAADESQSADTIDACNELNKDTNFDNNTGVSGRKFECHYCRRNFPTSQALGGHQNAHKRERQHAKQAHLHSAAMLYGGLMNYRLRSSAPTPPPYFQSHHHHHPPMDGIGSRLALWRIPAVQSSPYFNRDRSMHNNQLSLFANDDLKPSPVITGRSSSSQSRYVFEPKSSIQDQVSLDLHL